MSRVDDAFRAVREARSRAERPARGVLMPFVCAGRPSLGALPDLLCALEDAGAGVVEVGIPFSDPIADGPIIAGAMDKALRDGVTPGKVFDAIAAARARTKLALVAMVSVSIVHRIGADTFAHQCAEAGFDGVIYPDAPLDESDVYAAPARAAGLCVSLLIAPTTPRDRSERIAKASSGFVYMLARAGLTGERADGPDAAALKERVADVRRASGLPVACGFGISTAEHVRAVVHGADADAAIVGSALVRRIEAVATRGADAVDEARRFVGELALGLKNA